MRIADGTRRARVLSVGRDTVWLVFDDEARPRPAALRKTRPRLALVPGDRVLARPVEPDRAIVDALVERSFALVRRTAGGRTTTMAANVDSLAVVVALDRPPPNLAMLDELLAFCELYGLRALVILTKPDLVEPPVRERFRSLYAGLGYVTCVVNPKSGEGIAPLVETLAERESLLIGQSGVGKSSLFRALGGDGVVGDVSRLGRGRQTTTTARLYRFAGGSMIDSPGVSDFALHPSSPRPGVEWYAEVAYGFVEFRAYVSACKFSDCTHRTEPSCAVRDATMRGDIAQSRYDSFVFITNREVTTP